MQLGIGVDIEEIKRFKGLQQARDRRFLNRLYTVRELEYCFSKRDPAPHLAVRFCAKEAVVKALAGLEIHKVLYRDIEIVNTARGVPKVNVNSKPNMKHKKPKVIVSLSHTTNHALAFAIVSYV